jgi:hypothetical protein
VSLATCNGSASSNNVTDPNYTCKPGYYKTDGPVYCEGVYADTAAAQAQV